MPALEEILGLAGLDPDVVVDRASDALAARLFLGILGADDDVLEGSSIGVLTADRDLDRQTLLGIGVAAS